MQVTADVNKLSYIASSGSEKVQESSVILHHATTQYWSAATGHFKVKKADFDGPIGHSKEMNWE